MHAMNVGITTINGYRVVTLFLGQRIFSANVIRRTMTTNNTFGEHVLVPVREAEAFMQRSMVAVGAKSSHAKDLASLLACADYRGHYSHGMNRLKMYVDDIKSGTTAKDGEPVILKELAGTAWVDGSNVLGPVVGRFCTDLAIQKAKEAGIGMVVAKGSNHYGIAGWYTMRCTEAGLVGLSFTNTSPLVVPTRARKPLLGTNPISLAAPAENGDSFVLDMATSTVAIGKVELNKMKEAPIPKGWGTDSKGKETADPAEVLSGGGLMPVGGSEISGGYKGYGLGMMVEIMCGIMAGSAFGPFIRKWKGNTDVQANLAEGETEVLVAGDPERKHMTKVDQEGGVRYHHNLIQEMETMAKDIGVDPMKTKA